MRRVRRVPARADLGRPRPRLLEGIDRCRAPRAADQLDWLRGFADGIDLEVEDGFRIERCDGPPASNLEDLLAGTPPEGLEGQLGPDRAPGMAGGPTHLQMPRPHRGVLVVSLGSVGAPFAETPRDGLPRILPTPSTPAWRCAATRPR